MFLSLFFKVSCLFFSKFPLSYFPKFPSFFFQSYVPLFFRVFILFFFQDFNRPNYGILSGSLFSVYEQNPVTYSISSCVLFIDRKYRIKEKPKYWYIGIFHLGRQFGNIPNSYKSYQILPCHFTPNFLICWISKRWHPPSSNFLQ